MVNSEIYAYQKPNGNVQGKSKVSAQKNSKSKKGFRHQFRSKFSSQNPSKITEEIPDETTENTEETTCSDAPETLLIPLYSYDADLWEKVINLDASVVAIVNPNSGVGDTVDPFYEEVINDLINNGKIPIGYVHTSYGDRDIEEVKAEVDQWLEFYPNIKGFFIDEASSSAEDLAYYEELYNYIKSKGAYLVYLNAGTFPNEAYFNIADNIVIYENDPTYFDPNLCDMYPEKSSFIIYGADEETMKELMENSSCSNKYVTDDTLPNPYDSLPTYIDLEAEESKGTCY
jgi:hypothetical protein